MPIATKKYGGSTFKVFNQKNDGGFDFLKKVAKFLNGPISNPAFDGLEVKFSEQLKSGEDQFTEMMRPFSEYL